MLDEKDQSHMNIYPMHPDGLQRHLLLQLLETHLAKMEKDNKPSLRNHEHSLRALYQQLRDREPERKAVYLSIVDIVKNREEGKHIPYAIVGVSQRKFRVVQLREDGHFNAGHYTDDPELKGRDNMVLSKRATMLTVNVNYRQACAIYAYLVLKKELPPDLKKLLLSEQEDGE